MWRVGQIDLIHIVRTNIDIADALMSQAMKSGPYQTKKETVEAGLKLLARQAAYREILKWEGKLKWEGDESIDWTRPQVSDDAQGDEAAVSPAKATAAVRRVQLPQVTTRKKVGQTTPVKKSRAGR